MGRITEQWKTLLFVLAVLRSFVGAATSEQVQKFTTDFPLIYDFSNTTGGKLFCSSNPESGSTNNWSLSDGSPVTNVVRLRQITADGRLVFPPFGAEDYRQDVHGISYRCAASNAIGTLVSNEIKVRGVVAQAFEIHVYDVYTIKGNSAIMRCHIPKFLQSYVNVTAWIKDSVVSITNENLDWNSKYMLLPTGELIIKDVELNDSHTTYRCQVLHRLTDQIKTSLTPGRLIVTDSDGRVPPKIVFSLPQISTLEHKDIIIPCIGYGSPLPQYSWQKQTSLGTSKTVSANGRVKIVAGSLVIHSAQQSDAGTYICSVTNDINYDKTFTEVTILDSLRASVVPPDAVVDADGSLTLTCKILGSPVFTISWTKDGKPLPIEGVMQINNETIHISRMNQQLAGIYQCFVQNDAFLSFGVAVVKIGDSLPIILEGFEEQIVSPSDGIVLPCTATGNPLPEIYWMLDNKALSENARIGIVKKSLVDAEIHSALEIFNLRVEDGGLYRCVAKSRAGSASFAARISVKGKLSIRQHVKFQAVEEGTVQLDCPVFGYPIEEIKWERNRRILPVHLRQTVHINGSLIIENLQRRSDSGKYTCKAKGEEYQLVQGDVELNIMVPPKISPFSFQEDLIREGARAQIQCVVSEGETPLKITWRKDGQILSEGQDITLRTLDEFSSVLMISFISPRHNGNYTCLASNVAGVARHTTSLFVNVPPKIVPFSLQDKNLLEGMLIRISCVVSRGDLPLTINWLKNGQIISAELSINVRAFDEYSSVLSIDPLSSNHTGNYSCIAQNHAGVATHTITLNVLVPPRWTGELQDQIVKTGTDVYLNCTAEGFPTPQITWKRIIDSDSPAKKYLLESVEENEYIKIYPNGTLTFKDIQRSHEGSYLCIASNDVGEPLNEMISIKVQAGPEFDQSQYTLLAKKGEEVNIKCEASGNWPIHYEWSVNNQHINSKTGSQRYKIEENQDAHNQKSFSILTIEWVDRKDSTTFTCLAKNEIGESQTKCILTVQELPDAPSIDLPVKVLNQSVELSWSTPFDGNAKIIRYVIQYKKEVGRWTAGVSSLSVPGLRNSAKITNLNSAMWYSFHILAENSVGNSTFSEEVSAKTDETVPSGAPENVDVESMDANTLRVIWKPPKKSLWNGAIRGYNIGYNAFGTTNEYTFVKLEVPEDYTEELIYQLTDLKMYTQYNVIVQAYNSKGNGPISEAVLAMTSEDVPSSSPENVRCSSLSSKSIYVLWDSPATETVNGILRGYKVLYKPVDEWYDAMMQSQIVSFTKLTVNDLNVNTNYSIQVLAFTKMGDGAKSEPIFCKTHEDVPDAPEAIKVLPSSSDAVVVAWKPPQRANGALIKYNVYYKSIDNGQEVDINSQKTEELLRNANVQQSLTLNVELKGLKKNQKYAFWVTATSAIGESSGSTVVAQTVADSIIAAKTASFDAIIKTPWKEDVVLPCSAVGVPPPNRKWTFGNQALKEHNHLKIGQDGSIIINKITTDDSGNYTCAVYNEYGRDEVSYLVTVQVPPSAPIMDIVSKTRTSIKLQWKPGHTAKDNIKGYILHYKQDNGVWTNVEIRPDQSLYTLDKLSCGSTYQIYMEAFNNIGTGASCDTITIITEGSDVVPPSKENIIREGSSFITVHLDAWPSSGCPVKKYAVEYKPLNGKEWISAGTNLKPSQKKLVISGLVPSTWYTLRLTVESTNIPTMVEYRFATHTVSGGTVAPNIFEDSAAPVYIFYLDPLIFIPAVALLIVIIVASMVVCIYFKRRHVHVETPSDNYDNPSEMNAWIRNSQTLPRDHFNYPAFQGTFSRQSTKDPSPYATSQLTDSFQPDHGKFRAGPDEFSMLQHESYPTAAPGFHPECPPNETTFTFPARSDDYDPPPMAHMIRNSMPESNQQN